MSTQTDLNKTRSELPLNHILDGNILLFHAFNIGESIDVPLVKSRKLVATNASVAFPHFKNYHVPLFIQLPSRNKSSVPSIEKEKFIPRTDCLYSRIHDFGVISFCYKIPFQASIDTLKIKIIDIVGDYRKICEKDASFVFEKIISATKKPNFYNLKSEYYAIQVNSLPEKLDPEEFKEQFSSHITSMLRLETENLSDYQEEEILNSVTGYYGKDMIIIDSEGAFIFDDEYYEAIEFFELANIQKLSLQSFDQTLDQELNYLYKNEKYKISFISYVPLIGTSLDFLLARLVKLRLDVSVISERLSNSIKMVGDAYYAKLYAMLVAKLRLGEWKSSIDEKMAIINELYIIHKGRMDTIRMEMLEIFIIILFSAEIILAVLTLLKGG